MDYVSIALKYLLFKLKKLLRFADERKKMAFSFAIPLICSTFALAKENSVRDLAQLVAYYVRDVGVAGSSPVIPTKPEDEPVFVLRLFAFISFPVFVIETPTLQSHVGGDASRVAIVSCKVIWFCDAGRVTSYTLISWR